MLLMHIILDVMAEINSTKAGKLEFLNIRQLIQKKLSVKNLESKFQNPKYKSKMHHGSNS